MPTENYIHEYINPLTDPVGALRQSVALNNAWSAEQAQKQMDFQREMSDTAHQREVADLKAAGLNPVLSARLGGASTPSGAMAQGDTSGTAGLIDLLTLSMETANAAAGAARAAAGSGSTSTQEGLPTFKNPKNFGQMLYNIIASGGIGQWVQGRLDAAPEEIADSLNSLQGRVAAASTPEEKAQIVVDDLNTYYNNGNSDSLRSFLTGIFSGSGRGHTSGKF